MTYHQYYLVVDLAENKAFYRSSMQGVEDYLQSAHNASAVAYVPVLYDTDPGFAWRDYWPREMRVKEQCTYCGEDCDTLYQIGDEHMCPDCAHRVLRRLWLKAVLNDETDLGLEEWAEEQGLECHDNGVNPPPADDTPEEIDGR